MLDVTKKDIELFYGVGIMLKTFFLTRCSLEEQNNKWNPHPANCHSIVRAIGHIYKKDLSVVDGRLLGLGVRQDTKFDLLSTRHSWLVTPDGAIIDPYPVGIISQSGALLIPTSDQGHTIHGGNLYMPEDDAYKYFDVTDSWRRARSMIRILRKYALNETIKKVSADIAI